MCLSQTPHGASACGCGTVPHHSPRRSSSFRSVEFRDKSTFFGSMWVLLRGRSQGCGDPASNSAFVRRVRRPAESENLLQEGVKIHLLLFLVQSRFGNVTWRAPPTNLARRIASSQKPRGQRRCTLHEQDICTRSVSSTNPWQMLRMNHSPLSPLVVLVDTPFLPQPPSHAVRPLVSLP